MANPEEQYNAEAADRSWLDKVSSKQRRFELGSIREPNETGGTSPRYFIRDHNGEREISGKVYANLKTSKDINAFEAFGLSIGQRASNVLYKIDEALQKMPDYQGGALPKPVTGADRYDDTALELAQDDHPIASKLGAGVPYTIGLPLVAAAGPGAPLVAGGIGALLADEGEAMRDAAIAAATAIPIAGAVKEGVKTLLPASAYKHVAKPLEAVSGLLDKTFRATGGALTGHIDQSLEGSEY